jgi:cell wall-associated NlpC family hydrolase
VRIRGLTVLAIVASICVGCGQAQQTNTGSQNQNATPSLPGVSNLHAHPQAVEPVAGTAAGAAGGAGASGPAAVSVGGPSAGLAQPVSDAEIRKELAASGLSANAAQASVTPGGLAIAPAGAPAVVQQVIAAGNQIAHLPYRFGGGHGTFFDNAYDCSGSLSFVFAAAGLLNTTMTSGQLMSWGDAGPGKWLTVFATQGHTFMYVAGLRFDTVALAETGTRWSARAANESNLASFVVRHPAGL